MQVNTYSNHKTLWLKVLFQAIVDACDPPHVTGGVGTDARKRNVRETTIRMAEAWFNPYSEDFVYVCSAADTDPKATFKAASKIISHYREHGEYPPHFNEYTKNGALLRVSDRQDSARGSAYYPEALTEWLEKIQKADARPEGDVSPLAERDARGVDRRNPLPRER